MEEQYPELRARIQSTFIDTLLLVSLMYAFSVMLDKFEHTPDWVRMALFIGLFMIYEPISMTLGCTLGNFLMGIRVRKYSDTAKKINILQAIVRYPIKFALGWISFLTIHSTPKKRAIHDLASGTVMIKL